MFKFLCFSIFKNKVYNFFLIFFYFINLFELNQYHNLYTISKIYNFILKLNTENNTTILLLITIIITVYSNTYIINFFFMFFFYYIYNLNVNKNLFEINWNNLIVNQNLINGLLLIHPVILYSSYAMIVYIVYILFIQRFYFLFFYKIFFVKKKYFLINSIMFIFSIFLGSWWAEQELGWNGWWGWDFIEIISLNLLLVNLFFLHMSSYKIFFFFIDFFFIIKLYIYMFIVRFNLFNSIHNFIENNFFIQFFNVVLIIYILFYVILFFKKKFNIYNFYFNKNINIVFFFIFFV